MKGFINFLVLSAPEVNNQIISVGCSQHDNYSTAVVDFGDWNIENKLTFFPTLPYLWGLYVNSAAVQNPDYRY